MTEMPSSSVPKCCRRYLEHSLGCFDDWAGQALIPDFPIEPQHLLGAIRESIPLLLRILNGDPCPWHDSIPEDYLRVMALLGKSS